MFASLVTSLALFTSLAAALPNVGPIPGFSEVSSRDLFKRAPAQIITQCTQPNTVALTFDDGPWVYLYDVGKAVAAAGGKATFFFNGNNWGCIYDAEQVKRVQWAFDKGHQVASHTWSHANLAAMNWDALHHQFWLMEEALAKITGATPAFARPPYGSYNNMVRDVAGMRGQDLALWDFDSGDTWGIGTEAVKERYRIISESRPSNILALNHDVHQQSAQVVIPYAIELLKNKGYRFVTLAECLGRQPYQRVVPRSTRDASWTCNGKPKADGTW